MACRSLSRWTSEGLPAGSAVRSSLSVTTMAKTLGSHYLLLPLLRLQQLQLGHSAWDWSGSDYVVTTALAALLLAQERHHYMHMLSLYRTRTWSTIYMMTGLSHQAHRSAKPCADHSLRV